MITSIFDPIVIKTSIYSTITLIGWFTFWYKSKLARTEREIAYVCTLLSSFITSVSSIPLVYTLFRSNLTRVLDYRTWTVQITVFFMTFLVIDLMIGSLFYPKKIGLLTGWIHHIVYIGVLTWAISQGYCSIFIMMCLLEVPTFLLALGSVRNQFRHDYLFAFTFVLTRILFHAYTILCAFQLKPFGPIMIALTAFFPLHCFWFYGFIKQQLRLSKTPSVPSKKRHYQSINVTTSRIEEKPQVMDVLKEPTTWHTCKHLSNPAFHASPVCVH
ncbi:hypothetical protein CU097_007868 [Rhizopus azygosporus]|uniref:TLC domain-containing protein n=2 Tax=Rhizopus TaxID=4842 RepID=A0A367K658_RHIAZ|nr:hypothetical protein BCV71DRAFT_261868 [Rhizopus microsporus]RCH97619.1 hypothetical protein CU097_007868 [Rhizopus azygosporus]